MSIQTAHAIPLMTDCL